MTTRRDRVPRRRHASGRARPSAAAARRRVRRASISPRCHGATPGCAAGAGRGRRREPNSAARRGLLGGRHLGDVAVPQHLGRAGRRAEQLGLAARRRPRRPRSSSDGLVRPAGPAARRGGEPASSVGEPGGEDLVVAGDVVGAGAQGGPAGPVGRRPRRRGRRRRPPRGTPASRSAVTAGRRPAGRARSPSRSSSGVVRRVTGVGRRHGHRPPASGRGGADAVGVLAVLHGDAQASRPPSRGRARRRRARPAPGPSRASRRRRAA